MCGIFGQCCCTTPPRRFEALVAGLRSLQYRGYDSCGIAWLQCEPGTQCQVAVARAVGTVQALESSLQQTIDVDEHDDKNALRNDSSWCAIAHTRWATHGQVAERNTHPHRVDRLAIVHNGVVSNLDWLRQHVQQVFPTQQSETDTEVLLQTIAVEYRACSHGAAAEEPRLRLLRAVCAALNRVEGAFAIALICADLPGSVLLARRGSPLAIGFAEDVQQPSFVRQSNFEAENANLTRTADLSESRVNGVADNDSCGCGGCFTFASDLNALQGHVQRALLLGDDDIALLDATHNRCDVYYRGSQPCAATVPLSADAVVSDDQGHGAAIASIHTDYDDGLCMYREMFEQPRSLERSMAGRLLPVSSADEVALGGLNDHWHQISNAHRLVMIACGTSYYAALAARPLFERYCNREVLVERATPLLDRQMPIRRGDACFFLSQSGETADTLSALRYCRNAGALCVGIVNAVASTIARLTDCGLYLKCGPEIGVASTKAYTAQIAVLALIAARLTTHEPNRRTLLAALRRTPAAVEATLRCAEPWAKALAERWRDEPRCILLGRGSDEATCYEGALKIKELCYVLAEGCHAGELKHGPLALVDEHLPIVLLAAPDSSDDGVACDLASKMRIAIEQIKARGGQPQLIQPRSDITIQPKSDLTGNVLHIPSVGNALLQCIINVVPLQLLAFYWAVARGANVDRPRNLAKSVTVQ